MSLINRLAARFQRGEASISGAIRIGGQSYNASWDHTRVLTSVYRNPTGKRCIERNAYAFMKPAWQINAREDRKPVDGHPMLSVLNAPMPNSTGTRMQYFIRRDLDLNGGTFWLKLYGEDLYGDKGPVTGLKRLPPQQVAVLSNDDDELLGFIYTDRAGKRAPILPSEMVYVNLPDGDREWDRNAPGAVAGLPADIDNSAMRFNAELIANDGGLPGYLVVEGLDPKKFAEWTAAWRAGEAGGKTRLLSSHGASGKGGASYVRVGVSNQEMMYDRLREFSQDDICRGLGYPSVLLNPDGTTFANMDTAQRTYIVGDVFPLWIWTQDMFSVALRDQLGDGLQISFDLTMVEELTENLDAIVERGVKLVAAKAMTINELRDELGLPPVAWGNDFPEPPPVLASTDPGAGNVPAPVSVPSDKPEPGKAARSVLNVRHIKSHILGRPKVVDGPVTADVRRKATVSLEPAHVAPTGDETKSAAQDAYLSRFHGLVESAEKASASKVEAFLANQGDAIARRIAGKKGKAYTKAVSDWWDGERWNTALSQVVHTELEQTSGPIGDLAMSVFVPGSEFDETSARQVAYLEQRSVQIAGLMNETTSADLRTLVGDLAAEGVAIDDIAAAVRKYFVDNQEMRAWRFARTELIGAANFAAKEAALQSEVVTGKRWNAAGDADGECKALQDLGAIPLDDEFDGHDHPPAHPNCRCALTFDVD